MKLLNRRGIDMDIRCGNYVLKLSGDENDNTVIFGKKDDEYLWEEFTDNLAVQTMLSKYHDSVDMVLELNDRIEAVVGQLKAWSDVLPFHCGCEPAYCRCNAPSSAMSALEELLDVHEEILGILEGKQEDS